MRTNNKGIALIEMLAVLVLSSIVMLSLARLTVFLFKAQDLTFTTNRLNNEGSIMIFEIVNAVDEVKPDTITVNAGVYTLTSSSASMTLAIQDNGDGTFEILMDGVPLDHSVDIINASIIEMTCVACPAEKLFKIEFELQVETQVGLTGYREKNFMTSFAVFRGF